MFAALIDPDPDPDPDEALRAALGADPPDSVRALPAAARADLVAVIVTARRQQARSLAEAFDATLTHVPFPLRGVVQKVLGG